MARRDVMAPDAFEQLFASAPVGIAVIDAELTCVAANEALARLNGVAVETLVGPIAPHLLPGLDPDLAPNVAAVLHGGGQVSVKLMGGSTPAHPGVARAWDLTYVPIGGADTDGPRTLAACVVVEISERELLAEQLRVQARRHQLLAEFFEAVADADDEREVLAVLADRATDAIGDLVVVWLLSADGKWLEPASVDARDPLRGTIVRQTFARRLQRRQLQSRAASDGEVFAPALSVRHPGRVQAGLPDVPELPVSSLIEVPLRVRGETVGSLQLMRLLADAPRYSTEDLDLARSIAARASVALESVRARSELRRASATLRAVLDASPLPLIATDSELRITFWNGAAQRMYGWSAEEVLGSPSPFIPDGRGDELGAVLERLRNGAEVESLETVRQTKDGRDVEVRVFAAPLRDASGGVAGVLGVHEEIGARKQLEAQLFEARKMETVGRLAGGVAHDFNNIMTAIIGFAALSEIDATDPELKRNLIAIRSAAERAAGLTRQLLAFGRRQMMNPRVLRANDAVLEVEPILRRLIGEQIDLVLSIDGSAGSVHADPTQLEQVLLNLALNARDAMPKGGRLIIATGWAAISAHSSSPDPELSPGEYVTITVSDTGTGMDERTKSHLFEPFFTTKEVGKGTGLGLATTYGIVKQSGGTIAVETELGKGSIFKLYFPRVADEATLVEERLPAEPHASGRILLVEDEPMLRELARQVLTQHGFDVRMAANGQDALEIAERDDGLDLLLSDVVMPGMTGGELALRLRQSHRGIPVVLMSGYSEETTRQPGLRGFSFVGKPFTPDGLLRAVNLALSRSKTPSNVD